VRIGGRSVVWALLRRILPQQAAAALTRTATALLQSFRRGALRSVLLAMALAIVSLAAHPALHAREFVGDLIGAGAGPYADCPLHLNGTTPTAPEFVSPPAMAQPIPGLRLPLPADQAAPRALETVSEAGPRAPPSL
jgi:hypothetical protein